MHTKHPHHFTTESFCFYPLKCRQSWDQLERLRISVKGSKWLQDRFKAPVNFSLSLDLFIWTHRPTVGWLVGKGSDRLWYVLRFSKIIFLSLVSVDRRAGAVRPWWSFTWHQDFGPDPHHWTQPGDSPQGGLLWSSLVRPGGCGHLGH